MELKQRVRNERTSQEDDEDTEAQKQTQQKGTGPGPRARARRACPQQGQQRQDPTLLGRRAPLTRQRLHHEPQRLEKPARLSHNRKAASAPCTRLLWAPPSSPPVSSYSAKLLHFPTKCVKNPTRFPNFGEGAGRGRALHSVKGGHTGAVWGPPVTPTLSSRPRAPVWPLRKPYILPGLTDSSPQ